ncbi:MAG: response regulator [Deltaproteobacteria bacterium]|nr:response regulator [Deltaproteobacteria bacterium]
MESKRVLIADDAAFFRVALRDILKKGGYEVVGEATNGAEALEQAAALRPDIVILDVVMPVKNGLEAAREISQLKLPLKIVMCTSLGYEPIVEEAIKSGACAYIIKPLSETKVLNTLGSLGIVKSQP